MTQDIHTPQMSTVSEHSGAPGSTSGHTADTRRLAVSVEEAAAMLGISRTLAYELVHRGELRAVRLGRRLVVPLKALEELVGIEGDLSATEEAVTR